MELIYAALLLHKAGKEVTEESVKKVLEAAGVHKDAGQIKGLISAIKDINIEDAIKEASAAAVVAQAAPAAGAKPAAPKQEEKKSTEAAAAGLSSLFG